LSQAPSAFTGNQSLKAEMDKGGLFSHASQVRRLVEQFLV
jgi:hypothetical protein